MRKCELWDMGQFGGNGTLLGFAGTMDEIRAIVQMESGFLCTCAVSGVKMLPDESDPPAPAPAIQAQPLTDEARDTVPMPSSLTPAMKAVLKEVAPKWNAESIYSSLIDAALPDATERQITLTKDAK